MKEAFDFDSHTPTIIWRWYDRVLLLRLKSLSHVSYSVSTLRRSGTFGVLGTIGLPAIHDGHAAVHEDQAVGR